MTLLPRGFAVFFIDKFFEFKPVKSSKAHWFNESGAWKGNGCGPNPHEGYALTSFQKNDYYSTKRIAFIKEKRVIKSRRTI